MKYYLVTYKDKKHLVRLNDHGCYRGEEWVKKYTNHKEDAWVTTDLAYDMARVKTRHRDRKEINMNQVNFYKAIL